MQLGQICVTHWKLRNPAKVTEMVEAILRGDLLPPVQLLELPDGTVRIQDGHHRCLAYWMSGRTRLCWGEYQKREFITILTVFEYVANSSSSQFFLETN